MFFYYAHKVSQPGYVIRIASGCSQKEQDDLTKFHSEIISKLSSKFSVHFTPDFAGMSGDDYKYYNKPFGLRHWLAHGRRLLVFNRCMAVALVATALWILNGLRQSAG